MVNGESGRDLFLRLLPMVRAAFDESDVRKLQEHRGEGWHYDLCNLPLLSGKPLLLGLNPGRDPRAIHQPQTGYPSDARYADVLGWQFVSRSRPWLERYLGPVRELNYFNVCPFRSPKATDLSDRDWQLGIECFFAEALRFVSPPRTVILGTSGVAHLQRLGIAQSTEVVVQGERQLVKGRVGLILDRFPFAALPAPTNALTHRERDSIWAAAFDSLRQK